MSLESARDVAIHPLPPLPHEGGKQREAEKETLPKVKRLKLKNLRFTSDFQLMAVQQ